nr:hypothetical protein [Paenibacillus xylanexedens]
MYEELKEEETNRFYNVSKVYLSFLGEDVTLADSIKNHKVVYASTVSETLNEVVLSSVAKLAKAGHRDAAKELGQLLEKAKDMDIREKSTFDMFLVGLEEFHKNNIVLF